MPCHRGPEDTASLDHGLSLFHTGTTSQNFIFRMEATTALGDRLLSHRCQHHALNDPLLQQGICLHNGMVSNPASRCIHHPRDDMIDVPINIHHGDTTFPGAIRELGAEFLRLVGD